MLPVGRSENDVGLTLHLNLFRDVDHEATFHRLHQSRGFELLDDANRDYCYPLHDLDNGWVLLELPIGWKWDL